MNTSPQESARLRAAVTERLNAHDLLGVLNHGAPKTEHDPEMGDFVRLMEGGVPIAPEVVATIWHKWFGTSDGGTAGVVEPATPEMQALAADLQVLQVTP